MDRRVALAVLVACGFYAPLASAQRSAKTWRVGILAARRMGSLDAESLESDWLWGAFLRGMQDHGYVRGKNLALEVRNAEGEYERLVSLASSLVQAKVDVIVTAGAVSASAAQQATRTIPIVMATAGDPVGAGLIQSLARPGGNITGLTDVASDMGFKLLDMLLAAVPGLADVGVLLNPGNPSHPAYLKSVQEGAVRPGVKITSAEARNDGEMEGAFSAMAKWNVRGVIALPDPFFNTRQGRIAALAAKYRLPCISGFRQYVHSGGLMNYGPDFADNARRAAAYVDRIFKGAKPAELPVEQSTRFELAVNLKAASALGISIPDAVLIRADEVIR